MQRWKKQSSLQSLHKLTKELKTMFIFNNHLLLREQVTNYDTNVFDNKITTPQ